MGNFILLGIILITFILAVLLLKTVMIRFLGKLVDGEVVDLKKDGKYTQPVVEFVYNDETKRLMHRFSMSFKNKQYTLNEKIKLYYWIGFSRNIYIKGEDTLFSLLVLFVASCLCIVFFMFTEGVKY